MQRPSSASNGLPQSIHPLSWQIAKIDIGSGWPVPDLRLTRALCWQLLIPTTIFINSSAMLVESPSPHNGTEDWAELPSASADQD